MNNVKYAASREALKNLPITYTGENYSPIPHDSVIKAIDEMLSERGIVVQSELLTQAQSGQKVIGRLQLKHGNDPDIGAELSWKNSLDGSMSFGLAVGARTFICSNGSVYGDIGIVKRKHSGDANITIYAEIETAISSLKDSYELQIERKTKMREKRITSRTTASLVGELFLQDKILSNTQMSILKQEILKPTYDYKADGSAWDFYQKCTHAIRDSHPGEWHRKHIDLGEFVVKQFSL